MHIGSAMRPSPDAQQSCARCGRAVALAALRAVLVLVSSLRCGRAVALAALRAGVYLIVR